MCQSYFFKTMSITDISTVPRDLNGKYVEDIFEQKFWNLDCLENTPNNIKEMLNCICGKCCACTKSDVLNKLYENYIRVTKTIRETKSYSHCGNFKHEEQNVNCQNCDLEYSVLDAIMEYEDFKTTFRCQHYTKTIVEKLKETFCVGEYSSLEKSSDTFITQKIYFLKIENCKIEFVFIHKNGFYSYFSIYVDPDLNKGMIIPKTFELSYSRDHLHFHILKIFDGDNNLKEMIDYIDT